MPVLLPVLPWPRLPKLVPPVLPVAQVLGPMEITVTPLLYDYLDHSDFYANPVEPADRSRMNVSFTLADSGLDADFLAGAAERGLVQLKGHRSVGGMRASLYNAMPIEGVQALVDYLTEFATAKG